MSRGPIWNWLTDDPRWSALMNYFGETVPLYIRLRIKNAPNEEERDRWRDSAANAGWWPGESLMTPLGARYHAEKLVSDNDRL